MYVHLNLGKDPVKFRASRTAQQLSDGEWHKVKYCEGIYSDLNVKHASRFSVCKFSINMKFFLQVELQLNQNNGRITIDGDMELFTTQGRKFYTDI